MRKDKQDMKKLLLFSLASLVILTAVSCEKKDETEQPKEENNQVASITYKPFEKEEMEKVIIEIEDIDESLLSQPDDIDIDFLYEMQGYWIRPEGYKPGDDDEISSFLVESELKAWTPYFDGVAGQILPCTGDLHGLHLEDVEGRITSYAYDGIGLLNDDGSVAYVRTDDIPQ